jgi:biopolymer transport protein TolQ
VFVAGSRVWREARRASATTTETQASAMVERARAQMQVAVGRETMRIESGLQTLAIIASSTPFIGLFGTVIGIMNAFNAIGSQQQTSLAVVGPAIAEALLATGMGLGAAIPALIFYNKFASDVGKFTERLDMFAQEFAVRLSRRLVGGRDD